MVDYLLSFDESAIGAILPGFGLQCGRGQTPLVLHSKNDVV